MKKHFWPVIEDDLRPAKSLTRCFYCGSTLGNDHKRHCVIRTQTIVICVNESIEVIFEKPEDWSLEEIASYYKGPGIQYAWSSLTKAMGVDMWGASIRVVRFATEEDELTLRSVGE